MWRVLTIVDRMGHTLTEAASLLETVLTTMDSEIGRLEQRLASDAAHLRGVVDSCDLSGDQRQALREATDRIEATAVAVAQFAHRPPKHSDDPPA